MKLLSLLFTAVAVVFFAVYAAAPTLAGRTADAPVTDVAGLQKALGSVQPGGTIQLAAGTFPQFTLQSHQYSAPGKIVGPGPTNVPKRINILRPSTPPF